MGCTLPQSQPQKLNQTHSYIIEVVADTSYKYLSNCCCIFNPSKSGAGDENWNVQARYKSGSDCF